MNLLQKRLKLFNFRYRLKMSIKYIHNKEVIQSKIGEEVVMLDVESGFYFGLNSVASVIWGYLESGIEFDALVEKLMNQFDVERKVCINDTRELLNQMLKKGIVKQVE